MYDENYDGLQAAYLSQLHGCDELDHRLCFESTFFCTIALVFYTPPNICETNVVTVADDFAAAASCAMPVPEIVEVAVNCVGLTIMTCI